MLKKNISFKFQTTDISKLEKNVLKPRDFSE